MPITLVEYEATLKLIRDTKCFGDSVRQHSLFQYLLTHLRDGTVAEISEYSIAFDVFNQGSDFDSLNSSIVRVSLSRLRTNLKLLSRDNEDYIILLPAKSYALSIEKKLSHKKPSLSARSYRYIAVLGLAIVGLLYCLNAFSNSKDKPAPLRESFKPLIYIEINMNTLSIDKPLR